MKVVLQWSASQQETISGVKFTNNLGKLREGEMWGVYSEVSALGQIANLRLFILDSMSFIDDHVPPVELLKGGLLSEDHLVGGNDNIPLPGKNLFLNDACLGTVYVYVSMCACVSKLLTSTDILAVSL